MAQIPELMNNVLGYPIQNVPWGIKFPIYNTSGGLVVGGVGLDSKISINGDTPVDCVNEAVEIGSSGVYVLLLTQAEMYYAASISVVTTCATPGANPVTNILYPALLFGIAGGTVVSGNTDTFLIPTSNPQCDMIYAGCIAVVNIDGVKQARMIYGYDGIGSTRGVSVDPSFTIAPDSDDTFQILMPPGMYIPKTNLHAIDDSERAAWNLETSLLTTLEGIVDVGSTTTTIVASELTQTQTDHWKGRILVFTTGALAKMATRITAFNPATDTLTIEVLSAPPTVGDEFIIV